MKKRLFMLIALVLCSATMGAYAQSSLLKKYSNVEGVQYVEISGAMLAAVAEESSEDMTSGLEGMTIIVVEDNPSLMGQLQSELEVELQRPEYSSLMSVNADGAQMQMYIYDDQKSERAFVIYACEGDELVFISMVGEIDMEDLGSMMEMTDLF